MKSVQWCEEYLIRGRPDGTLAAHQVVVEGVEVAPGEILERSRKTSPVEVASLGALIGARVAEIVAASDAAGNRADAAEAAQELAERRVEQLEPALQTARAALADAEVANLTLTRLLDARAAEFAAERMAFERQLGAAELALKEAEAKLVEPVA